MSPYKPLDDFDHGILSPSGRVSKRGREAAIERLSKRLWPGGCTREDIQGEDPKQPSERDYLLAQAKRLRDLADRGMSTRKFNREAKRLERLAAGLETEREA